MRSAHKAGERVSAFSAEISIAMLTVTANTELVPPSAAPVIETMETGPWRKSQPITAVFNVTGHPAMCQPCGFSVEGLPLSVQFVTPAFEEAALLRLGYAYEQAAGLTSKRPGLATL